MTGCSDTNNDHHGDDDLPKYKTVGWYMKTKVKAILSADTFYEHNSAGIFGELNSSIDGKDSNDVLSYGPALFQVIFRPFVIEGDNGRYFSDYRSFNGDFKSKKNIYLFQLNNASSSVDLRTATVKITVDGPYLVEAAEIDGRVDYRETLMSDSSLKTMMKLIDLDNQTQYTYAELQSASLDMNGSITRNFLWVVNGEVDIDDFSYKLPVNADFRLPVNLKSAVANRKSGFGKPPQ